MLNKTQKFSTLEELVSYCISTEQALDTWKKEWKGEFEVKMYIGKEFLCEVKIKLNEGSYKTEC